MFERIMSETSVILAMVISLAIISVLVSRNARTPEVLKSGGEAFSGMLRAATGPVSGGFGGFTTF